MNTKLYVVTKTTVDAEEEDAYIVGTFRSLEQAINKMRDNIYDDFEEIKEWWEDEEEEETVEEEYQNWINENYSSEEHTSWLYTDDDSEHHYIIHTVVADKEYEQATEVYAILCVCIDGKTNATTIYKINDSHDKAIENLEGVIAESLKSKLEIIHGEVYENPDMIPYDYWIKDRFVDEDRSEWQWCDENGVSYSFMVMRTVIDK